jgi:hypothetical protein
MTNIINLYDPLYIIYYPYDLYNGIVDKYFDLYNGIVDKYFDL